MQLLEECIDGVADFALFSAFFGIADEQSIERHGGLLGGARVFVGKRVGLGGDGVHQPRRAAAVETGAFHRSRKTIGHIAGASHALLQIILVAAGVGLGDEPVDFRQVSL